VEVFRLHTFGGAFVARMSGEAVGSSAAQRRTVALLALLAVAGDAGLSRDKLVGLLWPDTDSERARHSLTQALYSARRALRADDLFLVGPDIRLNRDRLSSDVGEFDAAIIGGDLERAVEAYRGPFLDGFFVSGAPEFERWTSGQRERLEGSFAEALRRLAATAEEARDYIKEVEWRRRLASLLPLDSGLAVKLMTAMANAGDRAGAIQHARVHAALLREELDLEPDPAVEALAATLKEPAPAAHVTSAARVAEQLVQPHVRTTFEPKGAPITVWTQAPRRRRWIGLTLMLATAATLVAAGVLIERARRGPAVVLNDLAPRQRVVVAPFRVVGAAAGLDYLRDGIVELLSTRLADDTAARSVDAGGVLTAWRTSGLAARATVPRDTVIDLAARLGAERVVLGSVVGSPDRLAITAAVYAVPSGASRGEATVSGPVDSLTTLIDRLAARLLVADAGEDERLATYTSESLPALRAFLNGQAAFRRDDFAGALRQYDLALHRDSSFALAALYRALAADELNDESQLSVAVSLAWNAKPSLNDRDQSVLAAFTGSRYPMPPTGTDLAAAWQRVVDLAPGSAEAWSLLGARLLHDGAAAGVANPLRRAADAYARALAVNPGYVPAWRALVQLGALPPEAASGPATADSTPAQREAARRLTPFVVWRSTITGDDTAALRRFRDTLSSLGPVTLRAIARTSQFDAIGIADGARALAVLQQRATRPSEIAGLALAAHSLAVNRGRPHDALAVTTRLRRATPGSHAWLRLRVLDALYAEGDSASASAAANELAELSGAGRASASTSSETWLADACVLAQWRLARGDTAGVRTTIAALASALPHETTPILVRAQPNACAVLLDASLAVATAAPDAAARLQRVDSMVFTPQVAGDAVAYAPLLLARLYERRGSAPLALRAVRRRTYMSGWPRYLANTWAMEARLAAQVGDSTGAVTATRRFLSLRDSPEDALVPQVESLRRRLALSPPDPPTELTSQR
jgi:DNA-binding SARP family transcriptional activator/tetratricopeptide (TPR) repeat protein